MKRKAIAIFIILALAALGIEAFYYLMGVIAEGTGLQRFSQSVLVLATVLAVILPIFFRAVNSVITKVNGVVAGLERIHTGDYSMNIQLETGKGLLNGPDELDRIADGINRMQLEVAKREQKLLTKQEAMEGLLKLLTKQSDELKMNYEIYRIIGEETNDGMMIYDLKTRQVTSKLTKRLLGYEPDAFEDTYENWLSLIHPLERPVFEGAFRDHLAGKTPILSVEYRMKAKDRSWHWFSTKAKRVLGDNGDPMMVVGASTYIETWKKAQESIYRLAYFNQVTNLPNRYGFLDALNQRIEAYGQMERSFALMLINMDKFKRVNDLLGHESGDALIRQVADKLRQLIEPSDFLGHINGDEYVILVELTREEEIQRKIDAAVNLFRTTWTLEGRGYHITSSVGVSLYPRDGQTARELLKRADMALAEAKENGGDCGVLFQPHMNSLLEEKVELENALRKAVRKNELDVHYQPKVDHNGRIQGFEALMRWTRPETGFVSPAVFIPVAEETGLIVDMSDMLLDKVCDKIQECTAAGYPEVHMSVNLSPIQFDDGRLIEKVQRVLARSGVAPTRLEFEITESLAMENFNYVNEVLGELRKMGIRIALDDFGKGYSSLNYLKRLPIDTLKVDRDFVRDIGSDMDEELILDSIITLARGLDLTVVAEGVETWEQFDYLTSRGCHEYQGYLFSKPVPGNEVIGLLTKEALLERNR